MKKSDFESPPIKESEKRLKGDLSGIDNIKRTKNNQIKDDFINTKALLKLLELKLQKNEPLQSTDLSLLHDSGKEVASLINNKRSDQVISALNLFQKLENQIRNGDHSCKDCKQKLRTALYFLLPDLNPAFQNSNNISDDLSIQYFKELKAE